MTGSTIDEVATVTDGASAVRFVICQPLARVTGQIIGVDDGRTN